MLLVTHHLHGNTEIYLVAKSVVLSIYYIWSVVQNPAEVQAKDFLMSSWDYVSCLGQDNGLGETGLSSDLLLPRTMTSLAKK